MPVLLVLLAASLLGNISLYPRATQPLFEERDHPLIDRTVALASATGMRESGMRKHFFPIVYHRGRSRGTGPVICVELRSRSRLGHYGARYDHGLKVVEKTARIVDGAPTLRERIEQTLTEHVGWP